MTRLITLALLLAACSSEKPIPRPPVDVGSDPTYCSPACEHLLDLGCPEGDPVYNSDLPGPVDVPNQSCENWCKELQDRDAALNPQCLQLVPTCEQIEEYRAKKPSECVVDGGV